MTILIQSRPSNGASLLVDSLRACGYQAARRRRDATSRLRSSSFLVNWGCSGGTAMPMLNSYGSVGDAVNKLDAFDIMDDAGVSVPDFDTAVSGEDDHAHKEGIWLARHSLTGSGGDGITVIRQGDEWPEAPLYVRYIPKLVEFRVHVFRILNETHTCAQQKLRENDIERGRDQWLIRNRDNGWVFANVRDAADCAKATIEAVNAVKALSLDFGAVDVIIGRDDGKAYVLEVNTAPGIQAERVENFYTDNIASAYNNWRKHG